jgi:Predicted membrane protein (DUF2207)
MLAIIATAATTLQGERLRLVLLALGLPVVFALLLLAARRRDHVPGTPSLLTEPPEDLHPVDLAILWSAYRKHISPRTAYRAEILHLARIGAIGLDPVGTVSDPVDFRLTRGHRATAQVDRDFLRFMFADHEPGGGPISLHDLRLSTQGRRNLMRWWADAFTRVGGGVERIWINVRFELLVAFFLGVWATPLSFGWLAPHYDEIGGWAALAVAVGWACWLFSAWALPARLSASERRRMASWLAFRRYLRRFPTLADAPAAGVVLWGRHLAYAVALGLARRVEHQVDALDPRSLPPPWGGAPDGLVGLAWFRKLWRWSPTQLPSQLRPTELRPSSPSSVR